MDYDAFISYRRSDGGSAARWLRRELERFRAPKRLVALRDRRIRIYLDTAYERGTSDFYQGTIRPALLASRHLIVVATPAAVRRSGGAEDWIAREIDDFCSGPNGANVMAVRAAGGDGDPLPGDLASRFPNLEIVDLRGVGRLWFLHPTRAARFSAEKLKLIAPLIDLPPGDMPILRQEEERAQQVRLGLASGVTLAVLVAVAGLSIYALDSRFRAQEALNTSLQSASRMVSAASALDPRSTGEVRGNFLNQVCDLLDRLGREASVAAPTDSRVTCLIERARGHELQGESALADATLRDAVGIAEAALAIKPTQSDAYALAAAWQAAADTALARKQPPVQQDALAHLADRLAAIGKALENPELIARAAEASANLADSLTESGDPDAAIASAETAADGYGTASKASVDPVPDYLERQSHILRWIGFGHEEAKRPDKAADAYRRSIAVAEQIDPAARSADARLETVDTRLRLAALDPGGEAATDVALARIGTELDAIAALSDLADAQRQQVASLEKTLDALSGNRVSTRESLVK